MIPAYCDTVKLKRTLWSVRQTCDLPYELIVAQERQSVAKNRNAGLAQASQDLIAMLDDDVILPPCWASKLAALVVGNDGIGAASAKMTSPDMSPQNDLWNVGEDEVRPVRYPPGTCFVYSRERTAGCEFDEAYVGSQWEDTDWMRQVWSKGLQTVAYGGVWILHDNTFIREGEQTKEKKEMWDKNARYYAEKWGEA